MPPKKKRKRINTSKEPPTSATPATPATQPPVLINDVNVFMFFGLRDNKKNINKEHTGFRVHYQLVLNMKCCDGCKYINARIMSLQLLEMEGDEEHNNECAIKMKEQSLGALACHANSNEGCLFDYNSTLGVLPQSDTFYRFMWGHAQNEMHNKLLGTNKKSDKLKRGHETRFNKLIKKDWEVGTAIETRQLRHYLLAQVFDTLVLQSGKQIYRALDLLHYMI